MERYHIFKLGLAITFYAAYCIRPMLVYSLEADSNFENNRKVLNPDHEYFQYFQGVDGRPGRDYPVYSYIPRTTFSCRGIESGYYADLETDCQVFHICEESKKISFLCPNGTIFQQSELICEWWNKVNCTNSPNLYEESAERLQNEVARRKSSRRVPPLNGADMKHGAVMRTEEHTSIRATKNGKDYPVRQQTQRTLRIKNHRIPDNNEIEQQIEAESNNRHLANTQNTITTSQRSSFSYQNQNSANHNYNNGNQNSHDDDNDGIKDSRIQQTKKDIDKETGNFINQNYDRDSTRHSKRVQQNDKNDYNFETKTAQYKGTTLKEYHVKFGPTTSGIDSSSKTYDGTDGTTNKGHSRNVVQDDALVNPQLAKTDLQQNVPSPQTSTSRSTLSNTFNQNYNINNDYGIQASIRNGFSSTLVPKQSTQSPLINGKANRGSIRYKTKSNNFDNQGSNDNQNKNQVKSTPVTTYSPPVKFSGLKLSQHSQVSNQAPASQDRYDLPFPKHKSELSDDQGTVGMVKSQINSFNFDPQFGSVTPKQPNALLSSTVAPSTFTSDYKLVDGIHGNERSQNFQNQESDETQVPQESSAFVKSSFNSITDNSFKTSSSPYPNHRSTYSDIKDVSYLEAPKLPSISSITAHLVTTQPINNGKPFVGSRVGTTLLPNQPTTLSKYTYLPTTSTDSSKPAVIFGVIRHSSTASPSPYGPPELINLASSTEYSITDRFNVGNNDKTRPIVATTTPVTNRVPTESFNVGNTDSTIKPNLVPTYGTTTIQPLDILIPVHGSLNVGSSEADEKNTNQELELTKDNQVAVEAENGVSVSGRFNFDSTDKIGAADDRYKTTADISSGFVSSTLEPQFFSTDNTLTSDKFNVGNTDRTRPTVETTTPVTNSVPTEPFNVGFTDTTLKPNVVPSFGTSTIEPLEINVPDHGSLNLGQNEADINDGYNGLEPVNEPPFFKKNVPLLYSNQDSPSSTVRTVDHATVYGSYASTTQKPFASSNKTPYSPTVPTVTQSPVQSSSPFYESASSLRTPKGFNQGVPIRFNGQDKISVQLSSNFGGQSNEQYRYKSTQTPLRKINAVVRVGDVSEFGSAAVPYNRIEGFQSSGEFRKQVPSSYSTASKSKTERPRPFSRTLGIEEQFDTGNANLESNRISTTFPAYQISSARPFGVSRTTPATPFITTQVPSSFSVYDNADSMMNVLLEIANFNTPADFSENSRPGLIIPPSVGPQTLHSLAQYFANELQNTDPDKEVLKPETKEKLTSLLTAMTVHGYNNLFNVESRGTPTTTTSSLSDDNIATVGTATRVGSEENNEEKNDINGQDDSGTSSDDLLTTTSLPELRQLARNFSLALSSYLHDPDNFRKSLEGLRPTEPPPLDGIDNVESSTTEDELLNFSDADVKPSTPAIPSATWGYIVAPDSKNGFTDEVKNSLNPDLNTADSQSFIPRFNNLQVDEKQQKGFTDLPPNHWTSSPQATKLWQKALSINPAVVNGHFETTPSIIESEEEDTTESELFNEEVLPDLSGPNSQISYDLRELPPLTLNSTQVHGILIDFMNHTKSDEHNRLNRILKKLNTSEEEFLDRMKEIESNPLTKRLVLLLISECGANITQDLGLMRHTPQQDSPSPLSPLSQSVEPPSALASSSSLTTRNAEGKHRENHYLKQLVHHQLSEDDQDARALQLLNSLYTIASKFGRKR